jgi:hypothetical protein
LGFQFFVSDFNNTSPVVSTGALDHETTVGHASIIAGDVSDDLPTTKYGPPGFLASHALKLNFDFWPPIDAPGSGKAT